MASPNETGNVTSLIIQIALGNELLAMKDGWVVEFYSTFASAQRNLDKQWP